MDRRLGRIAHSIERRYRSHFPEGQEVPFALRTRGGAEMQFGGGPPAFTLVVNEPRGMAALASLDVTSIAAAYVHGALDLEGDLRRALSIRSFFAERRPLAFAWRFLRPLLAGQVRSDKRWIAQHYDLPAEFFLRFLDARHRCYSQAIFAHDDEPLEDAVGRKLDFAIDAVGARPGDRVLDIGGGWGAFTEHAGRRGIRVTSLTISRESESFLNELVRREGLPCEVAMEHLMEHAPAERYDAIVNLGVTEHLPDYRATLRKYASLLVPGGRVYLDASAQRIKHDHSAFLERYLFPGNGSPLCLHEYLAEVARSPFQLLGVYDDRRNYGLTTAAWARNLAGHREEVEARWGTAVYRKFLLYLAGCAEGFERDMIQAYRVVLRLP
jgi:cyclopropane-fatty-acyl-phospholipid synthase